MTRRKYRSRTGRQRRQSNAKAEEVLSARSVIVEELDAARQIEVWVRVTEMQEHFNDIGMRARALMLTVMTLILGAAGVVYVNATAMKLGRWDVSPSVFVPLIGLVPTWALWRLDALWFHKLLRSSVEEAKRLEAELQQIHVHVRLSRRVRTLDLRAGSNLHVLYGTFAGILVLVTGAILLVGPYRPA